MPKKAVESHLATLSQQDREQALKALEHSCIHNHRNEILLGWRRNQPAKNSWFVPGGRLFKNERINDGLKRVYQAELGVDPVFKQAKFLGVFEMFFDANFAGVKGITTHNISLAYEIKMGSALSEKVLHAGQHSDYSWFALGELMKSQEVHPAVKAYFIQNKHSKRYA